jgi:hypothetical protein
MAKLIAFGDSFTWGSDMGDTMLSDQFFKEYKNTDRKYCDMYSRRTWQKHLADYLDLDYKCLAQEGCSNQTIYRRFFESAVLFDKDDVISVNFTWRDRYDFLNDTTKQWSTVRPSGTESDPLFELYYKNIQSSNWDQVESLKVINGIISFLELNQYKYIITCIDELIYKDPWHSSLLIIKELQNIFKDKIVWFDGVGFYHWSKDNNYPISDYWHPLEEAHWAAFQMLRDRDTFKTLKRYE